MDGPLETAFPMQCNNKFYVLSWNWNIWILTQEVDFAGGFLIFFFPFCFSAAVGLWNWSYLLFKRRWRFLQMWKVGFRRPFQRFGYYQKKDLSPRAYEPWMRYHLCQVTSPQVFQGSRYVDTPCVSPHHFWVVTFSGQRSRQVGNVTGMQQERLHCHENWPQHRFYWNLF